MVRARSAVRRFGQVSAIALCALIATPSWGAAPQVPQAAGFVGHTDVRAIGPRVEVRGVTQDRWGFLWTASNEGVCRFDGVAWACPEHGAMNVVARDAEAGVWFVTTDGRLGHLSAADAPPSFVATPQRVTNVVVDAEGVTWITTESGLFLLEAGGARLAARPTVAGQVNAVAGGSRGPAHAALGKTLVALRAQRPVEIWTAPSPITSLVVDAQGTTVALDEGSLWRVGREGQAKRLPLQAPPSNPLARTMARDASGRLWLGVRDALFFATDDEGELRRFDITRALTSYQVSALHFDHEGSLWAGTPIGLVQVRFDVPVRFLPRQPVPGWDAFTFAVAAGPDGAVWSTHPTGLVQWRAERATVVDASLGLPPAGARSLAFDEAGSLWAGDFGEGLFVRRGMRFVRVPDEQGSPGPPVHSVRPRRGGGVWVGLARGGLATTEGDRLRIIAPPIGDHTDHAMDMLESPDGTLWIASSGRGLVRRKGNDETRFGAAHGIPNAELLCLARSDDGALWIGTAGAGLVRWSGSQGQAVTTAQGLDHDDVYGLVIDDDQRLWASSPRGVSVMGLRDLEAVIEGRIQRLTPRLFGPDDGVTAEPIRAFPPAASLTADGRVLVPTGRGVVELAAEAGRPRALPAPLVERVTVDGQRRGTAAVRATAEGAAELEIELAVPTFYEPHRVEIEHRLEGLTTAWQSTKARTLRFARVPHGRYALVLKARIPGQTQTSPETRLTIELGPPWHGRGTVRAALVLAAALVAFGLHRQRTLRLEQLHAAVLADRNRMAHEIHDGLEQDLSGLRLQIEAAGLALDDAPDKARLAIARAGRILHEAMLDLRAAIWGLQTNTTDTGALGDALRSRFQAMFEGTGITFEADQRGLEQPVPMATATHVAAIAREAVANATKHGAATRVSLRVDTTTPGLLEVEVIDDGRGIDAAASAGGTSGLGLAGMRARAETIRAALAIAALPEGGTSVLVRAPL